MSAASNGSASAPNSDTAVADLTSAVAPNVDSAPPIEVSFGRTDVAVGVLAAIAVVAALYLAHDFVVPLLIGVLSSYALRPVVQWLTAIHVPRSMAAALVLAALIGGSSWVAYALSGDAAVMIEKLPEAARKLRQQLSATRSSNPTALQNMKEAVNEIQGAAIDAGAKPGARPNAIKAPEPTAWLIDYAVAQSALLFTVAAQLPIVLLLTYFLLASGNHFRRKLIGLLGPSLSHKKHVVSMLDEIESQVQRYLFSVLVVNILIAIVTWLAFEALGIEHAGIWGVAAGVLHFIPYLGTVIIAIASGTAGFLQFDSLLGGLTAAGVSLLASGLVGFMFLTWLQSRFAGVNAAVLFIVLLFFGWLWGIWGLLLGAPLLAVAKVVCDRVTPLQPLGALIGR